MQKLARALVALVLMAAAAVAAEDGYRATTPTRDGIGKSYMGREIARTMGHEGAEWLERPERDSEEATSKLVPLLKVKPTDVIADIGAGTGYFTFRLAREAPKGKVYAVDVEPAMLDEIRTRIEAGNVRNVEAVQGGETSPQLPRNAVDLMLLVDAYHEFSQPREMMQAMASSLKPGGRLALVEYKGEDADVPIKELHKMTVAQVRKEMDAVGLRFVSVDSQSLPWQHLMIFEKPR